VTHAKPEDDNDLGPAMRQLTEKQQRFVVAYLEQPSQNGAEAARKAGYSMVGKSGAVVPLSPECGPWVFATSRFRLGRRGRTALPKG
jgi:hypothetical protein